MINPEQPNPAESPPPPRPSVFALVGALFTEAKALFGAELDLASAEIRVNTIRFALALAAIMAGGLMIGTAFIALFAALIAALIPSLGALGAALVTALAALIAAAALIIAGVSTLRRSPIAPQRALANLKSHADTILKKQSQEQRDEHQEH